MGDREKESTQLEALEARMKGIEQIVQGQIGRVQEIVTSQIGQVRGWFEQSQTGRQVQDVAQQIQEQAGQEGKLEEVRREEARGQALDREAAGGSAIHREEVGREAFGEAVDRETDFCEAVGATAA